MTKIYEYLNVRKNAIVVTNVNELSRTFAYLKCRNFENQNEFIPKKFGQFVATTKVKHSHRYFF